MGSISQEVIIIAFLSLFFLIIIVAIITLILLYQKRQVKFVKEKENLEIRHKNELLESQLEMQEQTFNTISREIHDNVGQTLSLAKVQLNIIDQSEELDRTLLGDAKDSVSKAMTDLRDIAKSLSTERIQLSSLPEITGHELQRINRSGIMLTSIKVEGKEQDMQQQKKLIIFRIIQEALQNVLKHSNAKNIEIIFCYEAKKLKIDITDNGTGFDNPLLIKKDGLGLQNIVNRAILIGGEASINSTINLGTTITITSPYA